MKIFVVMYRMTPAFAECDIGASGMTLAHHTSLELSVQLTPARQQKLLAAENMEGRIRWSSRHAMP
jgi:hypothetical protein